MRIVPLRTEHLEPVNAALSLDWSEHTQGIVAEDDRGIMAATIIQGWTQTLAMLHTWIPRPIVIRRGYLQVVFGYLFNDCRLQMVLGPVPSDNAKAKRFNRHIGFTRIFTLPNGYARGRNLEIWRMHRHECRWIEDNGNVQETTARLA